MRSETFGDRIFNDLLPAFCNHPKRGPSRGYVAAGFDSNIRAISDFDGDNFLRALEADLVAPVEQLYRAPQSRAGEQFFWEHDKSASQRRLTLWIEPIITVATLSVLHFELGWPKNLLGTQTIDWAFDVAAYLEPDSNDEYIACEVKKTTKEVDDLNRIMLKFAMLPPDQLFTNGEKNGYRKVKGLRARRAPLLWIVGPSGYNIAYRLTYLDDGLIGMEEAVITDLRYPA